MPRRQGHPYLCFFHARKEAQALAADNIGEEIANYLSGAYISACDLNAALGRLFVAVAQGHVKPKTAATLAYLAQSLVQVLHLAQNEYINAFGTNAWRSTVRSSFPPPDPPTPPPAPAPSYHAGGPPIPQTPRPFSGRSSDRPTPVAQASACPEPLLRRPPTSATSAVQSRTESASPITPAAPQLPTITSPATPSES